ncbi:NAD(P)/FAD-dependent oxidoreductase [Pseudoruegeria sp. HB172150]|uniref:NAD(P)/FAD-dependent oxidoreductase n=1 Tax=Pseudoruegeria sp. HB172150 TaxID=2721164 RepID=UPI0015540BD6|nr:NAD(P)/FAD-dependent oxidoreductase [Pseudoruegeria sp. HB172150]
MNKYIETSHYDALIVGARCAGAATAMLLARQGARVLLIDRAMAGTDTMSTHALMRGAVMSLHRWGLLDTVANCGTPAIRQTSFRYGNEDITLALKSRDGVDALYAPRRYVLDSILVEAARDAGAEVMHFTSLTELKFTGDRVTGAVLVHGSDTMEITADLVIGADGTGSSVARMVGAETTHSMKHATASLYGYVPGLDNEGYRWAYTLGAGAGAIPTNDGMHCVFTSIPTDMRKRVMTGGVQSVYRVMLRMMMPEIADAASATADKIVRFGGIRGYLRKAHGPGWALVGDAGYFKDPLTAHGITDAFRDAELLARAVAHGTEGAMQVYEVVRDELSLPLLRITDRIAACDWTMPELQSLHKELNRIMNHEVTEMAEMMPAAAAPRVAA